MQYLGKLVLLLFYTTILIGCGSSGNETGAPIPEEDQPTQEDLDADVPDPEEVP